MLSTKMKNETSVATTRKYSLPSDENKSEYVRKNFNEIAKNYDTFNDLITFGLHRVWKKRVIRSTGLEGRSGVRVLDLCSGSGDISLLFTRLLGPDSHVTALDFSSEMLAILKKRLESIPPRSVTTEIREGDATDLSFCPENRMDAVTIGFGLRNVNDRRKTLQEIHRVLKPEGRLVILDVGKVKWPLIALFSRLYFEKIVPILGFLLHGKKHEMYEYLPASSRVYPDQESLKKELEEVGFAEVRYRNLMFGSAALHIAYKR